MSTTDTTPNLHPSRYTSGVDRYLRFAEDHLGLDLADTQKRLLRATAKHRHVLIQSGNGVGKSFGVAALNLAFLYSNINSENQTTSGSYSQLEDTMWRPMKSIWKQTTLPGRTIDSNPYRLDIDDSWYWKAVSPKYPDDLEGRHAGEMLMVIEEADKPSIEEDHFKSAESNITDANDRMVAICNPPRGEDNIVYEKRQSSKWHVIQFSSFESHNVLIDAGELNEEPIPGLVDLPKIAEDWEDWNNEPWPGAQAYWDGDYPGVGILLDEIEAGDLKREELIEALRPGFNDARRMSAPRLDEDGEPTFEQNPDLRPNPDFRGDLNEEWYRRRAGIIPPDGAESYRPFYVDEVQICLEENESPARSERDELLGVAVDVARKGGDSTVVSILYENAAVMHSWKDTDHNENYSRVRDIVDELEYVPLIAVDAVGEGSGLADDLVEAYGLKTVARFKAGTAPAEDQIGDGDGAEEYYDKWTEGLVVLGQYLPDIAPVGDSEDVANLREELYAAARTVELEERRRRSGDLVKASPKEEIKERLGRSPDRLDAMMMAAWAAEGCAPDDSAGEAFLITS
ncbi:hypothetical protein ACERIT_06030 [Halopenitus sp. H-Gu1]|uniref:hypothetical protein n=1 Tax=Halopenitus sp. H-Gu1 TaxID=3242697 RepID=UPI00359D5EF7